MKVLLTGASGFVGGYLSRLLPCVPLEPDAEFLDIRDAQLVRAQVARIRPDAVVHLAAQSMIPQSFADPRETLEINILGTLNLLQALEECGFKGKFLYVGSGQIYGSVPEAELPVREETPARPPNPYAVSKLAGEALCYQWSLSGPFQTVMARPFNHIGPGQSRQFAIADFAAQIVEIERGQREPVMKVGDLGLMRDFTDVRDVVEAYALLLERGRSGEVYNICSGREQPMQATLERMLHLAQVQVRIEVQPERVRAGEQRRMSASFAKLQRETGWAPRRSLDESLRDILSYWRQTLDA